MRRDVRTNREMLTSARPMAAVRTAVPATNTSSDGNRNDKNRYSNEPRLSRRLPISSQYRTS